uniref:Uncharacterized protein n=1 Tax=Parascaris univalens TaxID=6257 RepID=A0A915AYZ0_PARUN
LNESYKVISERYRCSSITLILFYILMEKIRLQLFYNFFCTNEVMNDY